MSKARLAIVRYLNTAPLVEGLQKLSDIELVPAVPSAIARKVSEGEVDLGLASLIDGVRLDLSVVPVGMIGCDGPTLTVRVFSRVPLDRIGVLHADVDSHTSVVLARMLLGKVGRIALPRVEGFDAHGAPGDFSRWPESVLLIGDKVVTNAPPLDQFPHQVDLGEAWKAWTGLPFVYAAWMARADRVEDERVRHAAALLDRQRRHNATRMEWLAARHSPTHGWPVELATRYLTGLLRYDVGPREREGAERFVMEAARAGLVPERRLRWAEVAACAAGSAV